METRYQNYKKLIVAFLISWIIIGVIMITYWMHQDRIIDIENINVEFVGSVEHIEYDVKQFPTITVHNKDYYIGSGYNTDHQIEIGDSIIKKKGSDVYTLVKHESNKILHFISGRNSREIYK